MNPRTQLRVALLLVVLMIGAPTLAPAQSTIDGAWRLVEAWGRNAGGEWRLDTPQESLFLFAGGYYSIMYVNSGEPRPTLPENTARAQMSAEQMRQTYQPFMANAGTFELDGQTLRTRPLVALIPNFVGQGNTYTVRTEARNRILLTTTGDEFQGNYRLERMR